MVKALARAFLWRKFLEIGTYGTIEELAAAEKINPPYVSRILRLTLLAPDIVEAVLNGMHAPKVTLAILMQPFSTDGLCQRPLWGVLTRPTVNHILGLSVPSLTQPDLLGPPLRGPLMATWTAGFIGTRPRPMCPKSKRPRIFGLRDNRRGCGLLILVLALTLAATATLARDCTVVEPDSLQISWTAPCEDGSWLLDPQTGCRLWDWNPAPEDSATWSGSCPRGLKEGAGAIQWFEHGRPIDRFEGVFERGRRKGFGRYYWPTGQRFEGYYDADLPNGQGTMIIDGVLYAGIWRRGCLAHKDKLIAIGVPLGTCFGGHSGKR